MASGIFLSPSSWLMLIDCMSCPPPRMGIFLFYLGANEPKTAQQLWSTNMHEISIQKQHDIATLGANLTCGECCYFTAHFILKKGEGAKQQSRWENSDGIQITPLAPPPTQLIPHWMPPIERYSTSRDRHKSRRDFSPPDRTCFILRLLLLPIQTELFLKVQAKSSTERMTSPMAVKNWHDKIEEIVLEVVISCGKADSIQAHLVIRPFETSPILDWKGDGWNMEGVKVTDRLCDRVGVCLNWRGIQCEDEISLCLRGRSEGIGFLSSEWISGP